MRGNRMIIPLLIKHPWRIWVIWLPQCSWSNVDEYGPHHSNPQQSVHYNDVILSVMASQITSLTVVYSSVHSDADQRKDQSSASLAFVRGIHRWPVNSPRKGPVTRTMFSFHDVIIWTMGIKSGINCMPAIYSTWVRYDSQRFNVNILNLNQPLIQMITSDRKMP